MSIQYGDVIFPDKIYNRVMEGITVDDEGEEHWFWTGAKSGERNSPQIGCTGKINGQKAVRVVSVAKLLYVIEKGIFPYQIRRDRALCKRKSCVNPAHFYAIPTKPEPRRPGNRKNRVLRVKF